jgi:hypothetical protein
MSAADIGAVIGGTAKTVAAVTAPFPPPVAVDLLAEATTFVRPHLSRSIPIGDRLRNLWAAVAAARDLGAIGVIEDEFLRLAREAGLVADLGPHADAELRHVIRWAMLDRNPFQ